MGEVYDVRDGTHDSPKYVDKGFPLITSKNLKNDEVTYEKVKFISEEDFIQINKRSKVDIRDVLFAMIGTIGNPVVITEEPDYAIKNVALFKVPKDQNSKFLKYYLETPFTTKKMESEAKGTTQKFVGLTYLRNFPITIPPLPEQKRIVEILDEAFEAIDQAKANIEQNIQNAEELFQSKLNEVFSQKGEDWEEKKLKDITSKIGSGATPRGGKKSYKETGISLIRSMNVYDEGFIEDKLAFIDEIQAEKLSNVTIEEGDVLLNITGASVARCCVVPKEYLPARVNQHVSIIRLNEGIFFPEFLQYLLTSKIYKDKLLGIGEQGATRQAITKAQIEDFNVSYPVKESEQKMIVEDLNIYRLKSELLVNAYESKLDNLKELKKSILQKAFSGELTGGESSRMLGTGLEDEQDELDEVSKAAEPGVEYEG